jgi:hypothetical protein
MAMIAVAQQTIIVMIVRAVQHQIGHCGSNLA